MFWMKNNWIYKRNETENMNYINLIFFSFIFLYLYKYFVDNKRLCIKKNFGLGLLVIFLL